MEAASEVSFTTYSSTICHEDPACGRQKLPGVVALVLFAGGVGAPGGDDPELPLELLPLVRPMPRPMPRAIARDRITAHRKIQKRVVRRSNHDLVSGLPEE